MLASPNAESQASTLAVVLAQWENKLEKLFRALKKLSRNEPQLFTSWLKNVFQDIGSLAESLRHCPGRRLSARGEQLQVSSKCLP